MDRRRNKHAVTVGIFILLGTIILLTAILIVGQQRKNFQKTIMLKAIFNDVSGLQKGSNIWFAGVKIGIVKSIGLTGNGFADVDMKIEKSADSYISKSAKVKIGSDGLIGNRILIVYYDSGAIAGPNIPAENGDTLQTEIPVNTAAMVNILQQSNKNLAVITDNIKLVSERLARGQGTVGRLLTNDSVIDQLQLTLVTLQQASGNFRQLSRNIENYTNKLDRKGVLLNELVTDTTLYRTIQSAATNIKAASVKANDIARNLDETSFKLKDSTNVAGILLHDKDAANDLRGAISNIQSGTKKFDEDMEALRHNFLFRGFFRKRDKKEAKAKKEAGEKKK